MERNHQNNLNIAAARLVIDSLPIVFGGTFAGATAAMFMFINDFPRHYLLTWYGVFTVVTAARYYHYRLISKSSLTEVTYTPVMNQLTWFSCASGGMWGVLAFYGIDADRPLVSVILLMIFTGLVASASATMSHVVRLYVGFVFTMMLPTAYKFYSLHEPRYYWITALIFLYLGMVMLTSRGIRRSIHQSIELRFQNLDLIDSLTQQNAKTETALSEAQRASKAKTRFFAAANHDLRQPLHSLSLFTATLASHVDKPEQREIVDHIDNSVKSLEELFNSLLDISSLDAGTLKVHKSHFNIRDYIQRITPDLMQLAHEKNLDFHVDVGDHVVFTDPTLLHRIINNLTANAIAYTEQGSISIASEIVGSDVKISVKDTGKGIDDKQVYAIFDEFVQLDNPERDRSKGLGLGLSIVQRITDLLDIDLTVDTQVGKGSSFEIVIESGDTAQAGSTIDLAMRADHDVGDQFVLVIDDEAEARLAIEGLLLSWGCEVMMASSGAEAVQQLEEYGQTPDIIISDFRLRNNEDGGDAIKTVTDYCRATVPAIIITGDTAPERLREIDKLRLPTLHKPCKPLELKAVLYDQTH